jgi:DNA-binding FadR family transcriptional regulator
MMTDEALISLLAITARIACRQMTDQQLTALSDSIEQAASLSARLGWEGKAAAHAEVFGLLGSATRYPVLAQLASTAIGRVRDVTMTAGPAADGMILGSRRRLLRCLRTGDADGAGREMEHHLRGLYYMWRLAGGPESRYVRPAEPPVDLPAG